MAAEDEANDAADAETAKEVALAACSWLPLLGLGCDSYDAQQTYEEEGLLSWQMAAAAAGFIPFADIFKLPNQGGNIADAANAANGLRLAGDLAAAEKANPLIQSLQETGGLPANYVTKDQARAAGWEEGKALGNFVPDAQIGGDVFRNGDDLLPYVDGRTWYEADIGLTDTMKRSKQPGTRLVYSNDGLTYVTNDHYASFYQLPSWK